MSKKSLGAAQAQRYIQTMITDLNARSQKILQYIVDSYLDSGSPVGSGTIARHLDLDLSAATIRNVMADLESEGLLYAPHTSAGRIPTQHGMRLYIDGLMEVGDISHEERLAIEHECRTAGHSINTMLERASSMLSGLSAAAGLVVAPKSDKPVKTVQFLKLDPKKILVVIVLEDNMVENRIMDVPSDIPASVLVMAGNYLNEKLAGKTLQQARKEILREIEENRSALDGITQSLVKQGLAIAPQTESDGHIIVRGQSKLLNDVRALDELEKARKLLAALEEQETIFKILETTQDAEGVQIFLGTENRMFEDAGWSLILSPYKSKENQLIGAIGVIGPVRINYGRVIPVVDYTAKIMGRILSG